MWTGLLDLLFPPRCAGCGEWGAHFCPRCQEGLAWITPPVCARCGTPQPQASPTICAACRLDPPAYQRALSLAVYEGPLREAIRALKYRRRRAVAPHLGGLLAGWALATVPPGIGSVAPVPLHPVRLAERGFNQAELLARPVARALEVRCLTAALRRRGREAQAGLSAPARRQNVMEAFEPGPVAVYGNVLLVDDVFSTGSTAGACARALLAAGAEQVVVLTLARAVLRGARAAGGQ